MRLLKKWHVVQNNSYFALANETAEFTLLNREIIGTYMK